MLKQIYCLLSVPVHPTERLWLSPGLADSGNYARCLLHYGPAMVRGCNSPLHLPREQPEGGVWLLRSRRAAQVSGHPGAASHWIYDLCPHGLFCFHDVSAQGEPHILKPLKGEVHLSS